MAPTSNTPSTPVRYLPEMDGVDHINIKQDGKTELGRMLAHFYESHFEHPYLGPFDCMEGFWQYIRAAEPNDKLRTLVGLAAFSFGKNLTLVRRKHFRDIIMDGNFAKIVQNTDIKEALTASTLPITQYYTYGPHKVVIIPKTAPWLVPDFEELRDIIRKNDTLTPVPFDEYNLILSPSSSVKPTSSRRR